MTPTEIASKFICQFEGFRSHPYADSGNVWTIGYGTTTYPNGRRVQSTDRPITPEQALQMLEAHVNKAVVPTLSGLPGWNLLNANQQAACISMAYNIGARAFAGSSVAHDIAGGALEQVPAHMLLWNKANVGGSMQPLLGLTNRREAEGKLFATPVGD